MPHVLKMKDGKLLTPFGIRDLLDAVQDYAGEELRLEIESYIDTNVEDIDDYEKEYDRMEQENERLADHQRSVLCDIRDEVDSFRDIYLLATAAEEEESAMDGAVRGLEGWIECFEKSRLAGVVRGVGVNSIGEIKDLPIMQIAYEMGKSV